MIYDICANSLALNIQKTKYIQFSGKDVRNNGCVKIHRIDCRHNINCSCATIEQVPNIKYLGVIMDEKMCWRPHIDSVSRKVRFGLFMLSNLRNVASTRLLKLVYFAFIQTHLQYCLPAFGNCFDSAIVPLITLQKYCIRRIARVPRLTPSAPIFQQLGILPLRTLFCYSAACFFHCNRHVFHFNFSHSNRINNIVQHFHVRTARGKHMLQVLLIRLINTFPLIWDVSDKRQLKAHILAFCG